MTTSPFSGSTDLGKLIKGSTVKVCMDDSVWTGSVIGSKYNRSLVLTIAHEFMRAGEWLTLGEIQQRVRVQFLEDPNHYPCVVLRYLPGSDMLLLAVDAKSTHFKLAFPPRLENKELLTESELLGSRGHPQVGQEWTFVEGNVAYPRLVNNRAPPVMELFDKDLVYFEHRADMGLGYSGAPMVNFGGFIVGMLSGGIVNTHFVMGTAPFHRVAKEKMEEIQRKYKMDKVLREEKLDEATLPLAGMRYSRRDTQVIKVPVSNINFAIHSEYLEKMLRSGGPQYEQNLSLEDIYLGAANVAGSSTMQLA